MFYRLVDEYLSVIVVQKCVNQVLHMITSPLDVVCIYVDINVYMLVAVVFFFVLFLSRSLEFFFSLTPFDSPIVVYAKVIRISLREIQLALKIQENGLI